MYNVFRDRQRHELASRDRATPTRDGAARGAETGRTGEGETRGSGREDPLASPRETCEVSDPIRVHSHRAQSGIRCVVCVYCMCQGQGGAVKPRVTAPGPRASSRPRSKSPGFSQQAGGSRLNSLPPVVLFGSRVSVLALFPAFRPPRVCFAALSVVSSRPARSSSAKVSSGRDSALFSDETAPSFSRKPTLPPNQDQVLKAARYHGSTVRYGYPHS